MVTVGEDGKIRGGKVTYHAERALEAIRWVDTLGRATSLPSMEMATVLDYAAGEMLDTLAYDHARGAARAALNRTRKVKR